MAEYTKLSTSAEDDDAAGVPVFDEAPWWTRRVTHAWVAPILKVGSTKQLGMEDMPRCPAMVRVSPLLAAFDTCVEEKWQAHRANLPLLHVLVSMMGCGSYIPMFLCVGAYHTISLCNPMLLRELLNFVSDAERPLWHGVAISGTMFGLTCLSGVCIAASVGMNNTIGFKQQVILSAAVYRKALRLSRQPKAEQTVGEMVNLMSNDCAKFELVAHFADDLLFPFYLGGCIALLFLILGVAVLPGIGVMIASVVINFQTGKWLMKIRRKQLTCTDRRVRLVSEALSGIRVVKYNVMEAWLSKTITQVRDEELRLLRIQSYLNALNRFMNFAAPLLVALVTFGTYILLGNVLTAGDVFSSLAFFGLLRNYLSWFPRGIAVLSQCLVSQKRISAFLAENEHVGRAHGVHSAATRCGSVAVERATFSHSVASAQDRPPVLQQIDVTAKPGDLCIVLGAVGSGKTSLINGILGELAVAAGRTFLRGSVALCEQQPWIQAGSVRDNIIFGSPFEEERYWNAIDACALQTDLAQLPNGDKTLIGEKGVNISGGQKARIALARACYRRADVVLLDDVLAAVDVHVAEHLIQSCIAGPTAALRGSHRALVLVTNSLAVLPHASTIIALDGATVAASGTYDEVTRGDTALAKMIAAHAAESGPTSPSGATATVAASDEDNDKDSDTSSLVPKRSGGDTNDVATKQIEEERKEGKVRLAVYLEYFRHGGGLPLAISLGLFGWFLPQVAATLGEWWLAQWTTVMNDPGEDASVSLVYYGTIYVATNVLSMLLVLGRSVSWARFVVRASSNLHALLLDKVLRLPMAHFETNPLGRILNRFTTDIDNVDTNVDGSLNMALEGTLRTITTLTISCVILPPFIAPVLIVSRQYMQLANYFRKSVREVKRLQSTTRSPIFSHFSESLTGSTTIRAYGDEERFMQTHIQLFEEHARTWMVMQGTQRWLMIRMACFGAVLIGFVALWSSLFRSSLSAALVGLAMSQAVGVSEALSRLTRIGVELEATMTHVERVMEYCNLQPEHPAPVLPTDPAHSHFPSQGKLEFDHLSARYRPGLPLVLRDLSFTLTPGERVGLCGRTGSGKSSIANALFGMMQVESGAIRIDGVCTSTLGRATLRKAMSIIPQDPVLFIASLRANLDPEGKHSSQTIWEALEQVQLAAWLRAKHAKRKAATAPKSNRNTKGSRLNSKISSDTGCSLQYNQQHDADCGEEDLEVEGGLGLKLSEGGSNLSVGQRQLVCLARALLRSPQILLMDEATASVDYETDKAIQTCIATHFRSATTLTIAHRLDTVLSSDKIIVLDAGTLVEQGCPAELRAKSGGAFASMLD